MFHSLKGDGYRAQRDNLDILRSHKLDANCIQLLESGPVSATQSYLLLSPVAHLLMRAEDPRVIWQVTAPVACHAHHPVMLALPWVRINSKWLQGGWQHSLPWRPTSLFFLFTLAFAA